jgi:hypothetical protein
VRNLPGKEFGHFRKMPPKCYHEIRLGLTFQDRLGQQPPHCLAVQKLVGAAAQLKPFRRRKRELNQFRIEKGPAQFDTQTRSQAFL